MADNYPPVQAEPNVIINKIFSKLFILLLIVVLAVIAGVIIYMTRNNQNVPISTPSSTPSNLTAKEDLEQTIKQTFTDPKDQDIIKYISFASEDITLETKYVDYSKAYQLIYQRYATPSATISVKKALIKLRAYLKAYPQFKEADFKLPK